MTVRSSRPDNPAMGAPLLRPSSDIVSTPSRSVIEPPSHAPSGSKLSPLMGGLTLHSSGWMTEQW